VTQRGGKLYAFRCQSRRLANEAYILRIAKALDVSGFEARTVYTAAPPDPREILKCNSVWKVSNAKFALVLQFTKNNSGLRRLAQKPFFWNLGLRTAVTIAFARAVYIT